MLIGITGSIACGKTTVGNIIKDMNYQVIDCDVLSHNIIRKGEEGYFEVLDFFGNDILLEDGEINRHQLGNIIFNNYKKKEVLENIIHPKVIMKVKNYQSTELVFFEVPLLYEAHMETYFDKIIVIETSKEIQLKRLLQRDNLTSDEAIKRINAQMSIQNKIALSDYVIHNQGNIEDLQIQIEKIIKDLNNK